MSSAAFDGWTSDAIRMVERAIAAHGGLARWRRVSAITLPFVSGGGLLMTMKGLARTFPAPRAFEIKPHEGVVVFHGFPDDRHTGWFERGEVSLRAQDEGAAPLVSRAHRSTFSGLATYRRWAPLDALYFFGYALSHYHVLPFTLPFARLCGVVTRRGVSHGVDVEFPTDLHTHCRRQRFFFGDDGRIVRHDYVADVIGAWARGAHFWEDYADVDGLLVARRRRVLVRLGSHPVPITALDVRLGEPSVGAAWGQRHQRSPSVSRA